MTTIEMRIDALAVGGECVGQVTSPGEFQNMRGFVRGTAPTELISAKIREQHKNFIRADLIEIITPSASRVTPPCPYIQTCGGCDLQHLSIEAQRNAKRDMVASMLARQAKIAPADGVNLIGADLPAWNYRKRIGLKIDLLGNVGFFQAASHSVVDIENCLLAAPALNTALTKLRPILHQLCNTIEQLILEVSAGEISDAPQLHATLHLRNKLDSQSCSKQFQTILQEVEQITVLHQERLITTLFASGKLPPSRSPSSAGHFSQVNPHANILLHATVEEWILSGPLTELYAGAGNFSLPLARRGIRVDAVELDRHLVSAGRAAATAENLTNLTFFEADCASYAELKPFHRTLLLDPPRAGAKDALKNINPALTNQIVYISCDLGSLCRDLSFLVQRGYECKEVRVVDMFPQTYHVECIALLTTQEHR